MYNASQEEQKILRYWDKHKCFEKSMEIRSDSRPYIFYDGPPFATGLPHYGHIVASLMKDIVPRYWTMRGFRVERVWGWDCHGLPVENIIERDLRLKTKKDIEDYGIAKFNEACRKSVLLYAEEWKKTVRRMGRWVDMENAYMTMDLSYMESVWWAFKQLWDRGLVYKGYKPMHICPRCSTPLSNFEVTLGYKDIEDVSATVKFKIKKAAGKFGPKGDVYFLAWTTTPWTLPGNVLLAVNELLDYSLVEIEGENGAYLLASDRLGQILKDKKYKVLEEYSGHDLLGLEYEPLFPYYAALPRAFRVVSGEFVTAEDGTGVVHIAPSFGEADFVIGEKEKLALVQHVGMDGRFIPSVVDFAGEAVKPKDNPSATDKKIIAWLEEKGKLFGQEKVFHSYPHCWRCDTPLLNYAAASWFVKVTALKDRLLENNKQINWVPEHMKEGRFGQWLEGARDWAISRSRFWGAPLPIWQAANGDTICVGSVAELAELSGEKIKDLHKHIVDEIIIKKDGREYRRVPEVLDCWFESGSMPYAQMHYPFENKEKFEANFPAEFIAEGQDQTRGWFYTLHVLAGALTGGSNPAIPSEHGLPAFKNVVVNGIVLAEDGKKMSKRLKNYPDPDVIMEKFGADATRFYLAASPVMEAENLNFSEAGVKESYNKVINTLWNVVEFYKMYADEKKDNRPALPAGRQQTTGNVLDKWIFAKLNILIEQTTKAMDGYKLIEACRPISDFITELSQWYLRRSRERFKGSDENDKAAAIATLRQTLLVLSKIMAPFMPFIAEKIYLDLGDEKESVHLEDWPKAESADERILTEMASARKAVELGLAIRAEKGIKVRQPLAKFLIFSDASAASQNQPANGHRNNLQFSDGLLKIIAEELNVKEAAVGEATGENFVIKEDGGLKVALDLVVTDELKKEGLVREIVRTINQARKEKKLTVNDKVKVFYETDDETLKAVFAEHAEKIQQSVLAKKLENESVRGMEEMEIEGRKLKIKID